MSEQDDRLRRASEALSRRLEGPGAAFTDRVMAQVRKEAPPKRSPIVWATGPSEVRVRRWWIPAAIAAMLAVWFAGTRFGASRGSRDALATQTPSGAVDTAAHSAHPDTVYVRFELTAPQASQVRLAGDFSGWQPEVALVKSEGGKWVATVPIVVGVHRYQFVVDDAWVPDPSVGAVDDGFGGRNSVVVVGPKGVVRS